jgi:predicted RNase H-like HicB family nuclease
MVAATRPIYKVTVERDRRWWFVRVTEVPGAITQARRLEQVEGIAREVVSLLLEVAPDWFDLDIQAAIPDEVRTQLLRARDLQQQERHTQAEAATVMRDAARRLRAQGLTVADVGAVLGVSFQRAAQLLERRAS